MKKALVLSAALSLILSFASPSFSAEKADWWAGLKAKVSKITPVKTSTTTTTAVGGLRGAKEEGDTLYWKGKNTEVPITRDEVDSFNVALDYASKGEKDEAKVRFQAFLKKYPKSPLAEDAKKSIEVLSK